MVEEKGTELVSISASDIEPLFARALGDVREEIMDNTYLAEAIRVLPVGGYRSAIGAFWNAVVDDLRSKIIHRSLELFNKTGVVGREIKSYEDFQNHVNDDQLIDGAYKIGVIGWEANKILKHAKETRHIFSGHPKSGEPSLIKVLAMLDDCVRYVLSAPYPPQIIDIDDYITGLGSEGFDRNDIAIENALSELPEIYKSELMNRFFTVYVHPDASSTLRSNIEYVTPVLWNVLPKDVKIQIVRRVDSVFPKGDQTTTNHALSFVNLVDGNRYLSQAARRYKVAPLVAELRDNLDVWDVENRCTRDLIPYAPYIPEDLVSDYVSALVHTYVGQMGSSARFSRRDFYADGAAIRIPKMMQSFDDNAAAAFVAAIKKSKKLQGRITSPEKLTRLRSLGNIVMEKVSDQFTDAEFLELLVDDQCEEDFFNALKSK